MHHTNQPTKCSRDAENLSRSLSSPIVVDAVTHTHQSCREKWVSRFNKGRCVAWCISSFIPPDMTETSETLVRGMVELFPALVELELAIQSPQERGRYHHINTRQISLGP